MSIYIAKSKNILGWTGTLEVIQFKPLTQSKANLQAGREDPGL